MPAYNFRFRSKMWINVSVLEIDAYKDLNVCFVLFRSIFIHVDNKLIIDYLSLISFVIYDDKKWLDVFVCMVYNGKH